MSKAVANEILKEHGLGFVKVSTGGMFESDKCYTNLQGKRVKGIFGAGTGPMTVTDIPRQKINEKLAKLDSVLACRFRSTDDNEYIVEETSRTITKMRLSVHQFPAYTRSANLDEAYVNHYIVPFFEKVKKCCIPNCVCYCVHTVRK